MLRRLLAPCLALPLLTACPADEAGPTWDNAFDTSGVGALSGVWGSGPNDVFIVGGTDDQAEVYHYDGSAFEPMAVPQVPLLIWAFGFGPNDVYAVGVDGTFLHYDGTWSELDSGTDDDLWGIWGAAPDDLWIVGGSVATGDPVILHYDGNQTTPVALDTSENPLGAHALFKVFGVGSKLMAVGQFGLVIDYDGSRWSRVPAGSAANDDFVSLWGTREDRIVIVGGRNTGRIAVYDGSAITTQQPEGVFGLNAVFMSDENTAHIGGIPGYMGAYDVATGTVTDEGASTEVIHAMWGDGAGRVYAVGGKFAPASSGVALVRTSP